MCPDRAVTGIGRTLLAADDLETAGRILAAEATAERNPYRDFATEVLPTLPDELVTPPDIEFEALIDEAKAAAAKLIATR